MFIRCLVLIHRWLGIACCLLFAMWFASGIVLHFVPFPTLTAEERLAGQSNIQQGHGLISLAQAARSLNNDTNLSIKTVRLIMLLQRPVYIFDTEHGLASVYADTADRVSRVSPIDAMQQAHLHAQQRGLISVHSEYAGLAAYDQWSVPNGLDAYRPLHRIKLNDDQSTELYISDVTGEVVLDTTQFERGWNYLGAVMHWIYPTSLRKHWGLWDSIVWWLSLAALMVALSGLALGVWRVTWRRPSNLKISLLKTNKLSPFRGMLFWHHALGLGCAVFVITYIFSGWLSMDHGRIFSKNQISQEESYALSGGKFDVTSFSVLTTKKLIPPSMQAKQIDFIQLGKSAFLRAKLLNGQQLVIDTQGKLTPYFYSKQINTSSSSLMPRSQCSKAAQVNINDPYYIKPDLAAVSFAVPLYRIVCNDRASTWFHIDGANAQIIEKTDSSRRWYRWLYKGLHTLDIPYLQRHPVLQTLMTLAFCLSGLVFSLTGVIIGCKRLAS